jgi:hypothetical protein
MNHARSSDFDLDHARHVECWVMNNPLLSFPEAEWTLASSLDPPAVSGLGVVFVVEPFVVRRAIRGRPVCISHAFRAAPVMPLSHRHDP